jgi:hypothetical protein
MAILFAKAVRTQVPFLKSDFHVLADGTVALTDIPSVSGGDTRSATPKDIPVAPAMVG